MTGSYTKRPLCLERGRQWTWEPGCVQARPPKERYMDTLAAAPTQATQRLEPNGEQAESRMTNKEFWPC